jgi:hypothetical protein
MTYVKATNAVDYLVETMVNSNQKHMLRDKYLLRWANDGIISDNLVEEIC